MSRGPKTKLNADLIARYCEHIAKGMFRGPAAALVSVHESQVSRWFSRGATEPKGIHKDFHDAVLAAEARFQADCLAQLQVAAARDPRQLQWVLSRRFPALWSRKDNVEQADLTDKEAEVTRLRERLIERLSALIPEAEEPKPEGQND